ncbi:hypothetical protein J2Z76_002562 [Sedimentibacter acidaminivorans]|uniref:Uncharacterized protein n=1 Tax=Sedimentibacter acidaminivorans TaxID=913099 RepID=A0ABS4GG71_9FIRM|nr:hypothetical protein [Sedimentibacter acidaminivorans]MBP1926692.1 hypothetical protein [Sedimentibacter acidaminivorans]
MDNRSIGIRSLDIQTGLYKYSDPILDLKIGETILIGKAASLASHLRGIQVIEDYEALKALASKLGINATELLSVLEILHEIEYIRIIGNKRKPTKIEVLIKIFEETYDLLGEKWKDDKPDEFEHKMVEIINDLSNYRVSKQEIISKYDLKIKDMDIITYIGQNGGFLDSYLRDEVRYLFSPIYMEENPEKIMRFLDSYDEKNVKSTIDLLNGKPGYPIVNLGNIEDDIILGLMSNNILQTPAITASGGKVNFLFTPYTNTTDKEMVRHARNVVSAVRYGEKFSQYSELRYPDLFLQRLIERGYIGKTPHSDIEAQYGVLRDNGLGRIEEVGIGRYRFYLADTPYAKDVVRLAKSMIISKRSFDPEMQRGIIAEAWEERQYLSKYHFSEYIPNLSNIKNIKKSLNERKTLPKSNIAKDKINEALNRLFISGGEPDVF